MKQCIAGWENIKSLFSSGIWEGRGKRPHWKTSAVFKNGPDGLNVWGLTPRGHRGLYVYVCVQPCVCMCSFSVVIRECVYAPGFKLQLITSSRTHTHTRMRAWGRITMQCYMAGIILPQGILDEIPNVHTKCDFTKFWICSSERLLRLHSGVDFRRTLFRHCQKPAPQFLFTVSGVEYWYIATKHHAALFTAHFKWLKRFIKAATERVLWHRMVLLYSHVKAGHRAPFLFNIFYFSLYFV